jgi:hypothetical protein
MRRRASAPAAPAADPLLGSLEQAVAAVFGHLRRSVQRNLAVVAVAFVRLLSGARSGHGRLSLGALARVSPTAGTPHAREKRLGRFLNNPRLDARGVASGLARVVFGARGAGCWPLLLDQTCSGATQALVAGVPFEGRALPLGVYTFDYPWQEAAADSQNQVERVFLLDVESALPPAVQPVWIGDRGYARAALLAEAEREERWYVIRGRAGTCVEYQGQRQKLGALPPGPRGTAVRYVGVRYQARVQVCVDVVVVHDPAFTEPWALLVPPHSAKGLPTALIVALYRERMQVEHTFRDFKTHLGLRGLQLRVRIAERTGRLLLAFCLAYALAVILGSRPEAAGGRADLEIPRRTPRHGSSRTLSVLSVATQMLAHPKWTRLAQHLLRTLIHRLARGQPALAHPPPDLDARRAAA